jgi:hypothetical protein
MDTREPSADKVEGSKSTSSRRTIVLEEGGAGARTVGEPPARWRGARARAVREPLTRRRGEQEHRR